MHTWSKDIAADMLESGKWYVDRVTNYAPGTNMIQLSLKKFEKTRPPAEPFPGLTDQLKEFLHSDEVIGLANLVVDKNEYLLDVMTRPVLSTHEEEAQQ